MGKLSEAIQWINDAGIHSRPGEGDDFRTGIDPEVKAAAFRTSGMVHFFSADFAKALEDLQESVRLFSDAGDELNMARSLSYYAVVSISAGNQKASDCFQQAIRLGQRYDDTYSIVVSSTFQSEVMLACRDTQHALELVMEALDRCRQEGDLFLLAMVLLQAGNIYLTLSEYQIAAEYYQEGLDIHKAFPLGPSVGWFYMGMGFCRLMEGDINEGRTQFCQGLEIGRESGDLSDIIGGLIGMGCTVFSEGDATKAARLLGAAETPDPKIRLQIVVFHCRHVRMAAASIEKGP
jgi:tetratricopeptide (TPR) repeat protein